ncbi:hypothetical protein V6N13_029198 [Hibiscus sabdariffa]|uniref:Uncharacterized protein n=1 Tax=Hibiscus sabdariffa TaxID=183260 RepID=A0ABR2TAP3_9ROSI
MGCQASKLYRQKDRVKSKVTFLLSWRLDAIKRRRSHSSISKQMLLKPESEDGSTNDRRSSTLSYREPDDDSVWSARMATESIEPAVVVDNKGNGDDVEAHKSIYKETSAMEKMTLEEQDHKKERSNSLIFPASPSFRFYLTDDNKEEDCSSKDELPMERSFSDADADISGPRTSSEEVGSTTKKRGRRGMRFRRVIPLGRPVKNFLKAKCRS